MSQVLLLCPPVPVPLPPSSPVALEGVRRSGSRWRAICAGGGAGVVLRYKCARTCAMRRYVTHAAAARQRKCLPSHGAPREGGKATKFILSQPTHILLLTVHATAMFWMSVPAWGRYVYSSKNAHNTPLGES